MADDELLTLLYYDLKTGFGSAQELYRQAKSEKPTILLEDVKTWLSKQPNKQRKAYKGSGNRCIANFARDQFQMDIGDMIELKKKDEQARYILSIIDIFSKYAMAFVLKETQPRRCIKPYKRHLRPWAYQGVFILMRGPSLKVRFKNYSKVRVFNT
jgi:hypothetical protein